MFCPNCGKQVPDNIKFCVNCGASLEIINQYATPQQSGEEKRPKPETQEPEEAAVYAELQASQEQPANSPEKNTQPQAALHESDGQSQTNSQKSDAQPEKDSRREESKNGETVSVAVSDSGQIPSSSAVNNANTVPGTAGTFGTVEKTGKTAGKKMPFLIGGAAFAAVLILVIVLTAAFGGEKDVNTFSMDSVSVTVPMGYDYAGNSKMGISFQYPTSASVRDNDAAGIYIYPTGSAGVPYILIETVNKKVKTESYFKDYDKELKKDYSSPQIEEIKKVNVGGKTLYMQRTTVFNDGSDQTIDRYIEVYKNKTIEYTVKTLQPGSVDDVLSFVIQSMCPETGVYGDAVYRPESTGSQSEIPSGEKGGMGGALPFGNGNTQNTMPGENNGTGNGSAANMVTASCEEVNLSMSMPQGMEWEDIDIGVLGMSSDLLLFAAYEDTDYRYAAIYNAEDILTQASGNMEILKEQLYLESVQLNGYNQTTLGGLNGYVCDVNLDYGGFTGSGKLYILTPANTLGVYMVYYAVSSGASDAAKAQAQGEAAVASFKTIGAPSDTAYALCGMQDGSFCFAVDTGLVNGAEQTANGCNVNVNMVDNAQHVITVQKNNYASNGITTVDQFMQSYNQSVGLTTDSVQLYEGGRYEFKYLYETYSNDGTNMAVFLIACADSQGNIYTIYAEDEDSLMDNYETVMDDIVWSFFVNGG